MDELYILLTGFFVSAACALLGCYLVLRKMALMGDAISHAVLPGIVIAYLATGSRDSLVMAIGAILIGLLTSFLIEYLHVKARLQEDASIGVIFTTLFAIGVILISYYSENIDLDQDCVLYGEIALIALDSTSFLGYPIGPMALWVSLIVLLAVVAFIWIGYKELFLTTFDSGYATSLGITAGIWHYALMGMVSVTTVASFEAVGAILVVAFLVAPAATAYLLTYKFKYMLIFSVLIALVSTVVGYYLSYLLDASIAGCMTTCAGFLFMLALFFSPVHGIITKKYRKISSSL